MALGFQPSAGFERVIGWILYQVRIDKHHVMFIFNDENALLNVSNKFSYLSKNGKTEFTYEVYGSNKWLSVDELLGKRITSIRVVSLNRLDIEFENGDVLSIYDSPEFRSWWFKDTAFVISDLDIDDMSEVEIVNRKNWEQTPIKN